MNIPIQIKTTQPVDYRQSIKRTVNNLRKPVSEMAKTAIQQRELLNKLEYYANKPATAKRKKSAFDTLSKMLQLSKKLNQSLWTE